MAGKKSFFQEDAFMIPKKKEVAHKVDEVKEVVEVNKVEEVKEVVGVAKPKKKPVTAKIDSVGTNRKRIWMAFTPEIYNWILTESIREGVSNSVFISNLATSADPTEVATYEKVRISQMTQGKKDAKADRINLSVEPSTHALFLENGRKCGMNMTDYVNTILLAEMNRR